MVSTELSCRPVALPTGLPLLPMLPDREPISPAGAQRPLFVGLDVGGTNTKLGVVDDRGRTLIAREIPTESAAGPQQAMERFAAAVRSLLAECQVAGEEVPRIGLATPGTMDLAAGRLLQPHNLPGWQDFAARAALEAASGWPVTFSNDATAAAYGEYWVGRGESLATMAMITLGTGIGGGAILGETTIDGAHSHGSEFGHMIIDYTDTARLCPCGQLGHLEAYASARSLIRRAEEALLAGRPSALADRQEANGPEPLTPLAIAQAAEAGDALAEELAMDTAKYLGIGVVNVMNCFNPAAVVLGGAMTFGGGASELGRRFLARVKQEVRRRAFPIPAARTTIDFATLGGDAGYIGAAGIARLDYHRQLHS